MVSSADYTALVFDKLVYLSEISGKSLSICLILIADVCDDSLAILVLSLIKVVYRILLKNKI